MVDRVAAAGEHLHFGTRGVLSGKRNLRGIRFRSSPAGADEEDGEHSNHSRPRHEEERLPPILRFGDAVPLARDARASRSCPALLWQWRFPLWRRVDADFGAELSDQDRKARNLLYPRLRFRRRVVVAGAEGTGGVTPVEDVAGH